jgi:signal transduction histidine kinase
VRPGRASGRFPGRWWAFPALAVLFAAAIGGGGWLFFRKERTHSRATAQSELSAIANMKADQIARWIAERRSDAELAREKAESMQFLSTPAGASVREPLLRWIGVLRRTSDYAVVALYDATGTLRLAVPSGDTARYPCLPEHVQAALRARDIVFADLHRAGPGEPIHMCFLVPIGASSDAEKPAAGVLVLLIDPYRFLYPLVQNWPLPSPTAETLLVRREGDDVLFLNELRHRSGTALALRAPIRGSGGLPAARAVLGGGGLMEGVDYRGIGVLAAMRQIAGTPWSMVAKVDRAEIYAPDRSEALLAGLVSALIFLSVLLTAGLVLRRQKLSNLRLELADRRRGEASAKAGEEEKKRQLGDADKSRRILLSILEDRKAAEDEARRSEALLSSALRMAGAGHWEYDVASDAFTFNDNFYRIFHTSAAEVGGYTMSSAEYGRRFCHPEDAPLVQEEVEAAIASDDPGYSRYLEHRILYADGSVGHIAVRFSIVKDAQGRTIKTHGLDQDITERIRKEEEDSRIAAQLQQQQKLESIGVLASGVAHEINNPINGILNYAQLIFDGLETEDPMGEYAADIMKECDRVTTIVHNLLSFSRQEKQSHSPARIEDILNAALSLIRAVMRHDQIRIEVETAPDLPSIKCRSQQIQQVILNLLTNARDALNERFPGFDEAKVVKIDVRLIEKDREPWIRVAVENLGTPVTAEVRDHLFVPFYTTKPKDRGTGLGLSISYGIVKDHHGDIYLDSGPGQATRFHLELPVNNGWHMG